VSRIVNTCNVTGGLSTIGSDPRSELLGQNVLIVKVSVLTFQIIFLIAFTYFNFRN
jgi:hypothetical protein